MTHKLFTILIVFVLLAVNQATALAQPSSLVTTSAEWIVKIPTAVPQARLGQAMAYDSRRGVVVLFGGYSYTGFLNDTVEMTAGTWVKRIPARAPAERYGHVMIYDSVRSETVLFGGCGAPADTWTWDGADWTEQHQIQRISGQ